MNIILVFGCTEPISDKTALTCNSNILDAALAENIY